MAQLALFLNPDFLARPRSTSTTPSSSWTSRSHAAPPPAGSTHLPHRLLRQKSPRARATESTQARYGTGIWLPAQFLNLGSNFLSTFSRPLGFGRSSSHGTQINLNSRIIIASILLVEFRDRRPLLQLRILKFRVADSILCATGDVEGSTHFQQPETPGAGCVRSARMALARALLQRALFNFFSLHLDHLPRRPAAPSIHPTSLSVTIPLIQAFPSLL